MKRIGKRSLAFLLALIMVLSLFNGLTPFKAQAATPTYFEAYTKASYEKTSTDFGLTVSGQKVDVVEYFNGRYSYAHIAYEGTATFEIESLNGNIDSYNISPHSYNIEANVNGNKMTFDLEQKGSRYLVIQVKVGGTQYEFIISADPNLGLTAPTVDNVKVVNVKDRGVNSSNSDTGARNSAKIQAIIDEVSANGGGTVYFPAGVYKFVNLDAKSNVTLYLDAGAVLRGSGDRTEYSWSDSGVNGRQVTRRDILIGNGVKNFKIIGEGTIDANSAVLALPRNADGGTTDVPSISQEEYNEQNGTNYYPDGWDDFRKGIVDAQNADGIEFTGVTFKDATGWTFHIQNSSNIVMDNVKMLNDYDIVHSDGYDLAACQYVTVTDCLGVCGDDVFCPKGSNSNRDMSHYLFKDGVAYAKGGAGCKVGVQAESDTYDIEFNNIDVIRGYRGFSVSRDEGSGDWSDIRFIDVRTEKLYIENANDTGQYRPAPFVIWSHQKDDKIGNVSDIEVTRCSVENCGGLKGILEGETSATSKVPGYVSNVRFTDLVMEGRTITSDNYTTKVMYKGNVQADTVTYNYTELLAPTTSVYEAENGTRSGSSLATADACSGGMLVGNLGLINGTEGSVTLTVYAETAGEYDVDVYYCSNGTRTFYVSTNDGEAQTVSCTGNSFTAPSMTTIKVNLNKGENTIKFTNPNAAAPNLDKIEVIEKEIENETGATPTNQLKENTYYEIISKKSGKALTVSGYATANNAEIIQMPANKYESQIWTLEDAGNGYYQIVNKHSGKSINVPWASTEEGTQVIQFNKGGDNNSKWLMEDTGDGYYRITPYLVATFGLNVEGNSNDNGAAIIQWTYSGTDNSKWEFREVSESEIKSNPEMEIPNPRTAMDAWLAKFYYTEEKNGQTLGRLRNQPSNGFWTDAEIIEVMIDAYEELGDKKYIEIAEQFYAGFVDRRGTDWKGNGFNDDVLWMSLATVRLYLNTGKQEYLDVAEYNFNLTYDRAWDETVLDGGLWWTTDNKTKNACVNGPGALAAYYLGEATGNKTYYEKAQKIVDWMIEKLVKDNGVVIDNISADGTIFDGYVSTGNQGNFMGAAAAMYKYTGDQKYLDAAIKVADHTITMGDAPEGYLNREWHERDGCGGKGILGRWFSFFVQECNISTYDEWILNNGMAAWFNRNSDNLMWSAFGRLTEDNIENSNTLMEADTPMKEFAAWGCTAAVSWVLNMTYPETESAGQWEVKSPDNSTVMTVKQADNGSLSYSVKQDGITIVEDSSLGINTNLGDFTTGLNFKRTNTTTINETYSVISGKKSKYTNNANETELVFAKDNSNTEFSVIIRAYDDGIAFRYAIKTGNSSTLTISPNNEITGITLPAQSQMWYMEYANDFMYERDYVTGTIGSVATDTILSMPMLYKTGGKYALITEAEKTGTYVGSELKVGNNRVLTTVFDPDQKSNVTTQTPFKSPWRAIVIGDEETIVNNTMTENLSPAPSAQYNFEDWVEPGVSSWSWVSYEGRQEDPETHKKFIALAANMGWEYYILDEKWQPNSNTGGARYEGMFDWFDEVKAYADEKGVKLIAWVNKTDIDTDAEREARFKEWSEKGIVGIKADFFYDETQASLQLHEDIYADAAKYKLLVNIHGSNPPSGEIRTYPNVIAREAIKGQEQGGITAEQYTIIPFIRAAVGTADVTEQLYSRDTGKTSMGFQIALSTLVENGIRSMGGRPEDYYSVPEAVDYYKDFPQTWDDTSLIDASVGEYVDIARKSGDVWYAAGISTTAKTVSWKADFLDSGKQYTAFFYTEDGNARDALATKVQKNVTKDTELSFNVQAGGGYAVKLVPQSEGLQSLNVSNSNVKVQVYNTTNIKVTMTPASMNLTDITWEVANPSIAKVVPTGVGAEIKGLKAGTTQVTVTSAYDTSIKAVIQVEVTPATYELDANKWMVINDNGNYVVNNENSVTIEGEFGVIDNNVFAMKVPNNEDFDITAKVSGDLFANYQGGFIAAFDSTNLNNYAAAGRRYHQYMAQNGNRNLFGMMGRNVEFYTADNNKTSTAYVRLVKQGNTFTGYYRFNENDAWTQITNGNNTNITNESLATSQNLCVGFFAGSGGTRNNREITFEDFTYNGTPVNFANYNTNAEAGYTFYNFEGENGTLTGGAVDADATGCSNGAYAGNIGGATHGTASFTVNCDTASTRKINIYYATAQQRSFSVIVNGEAQTVVCPSTGGWGTPNTDPIVITVDLQQGENIIQFTGVGDAYAPNLDRFEIQLTEAEINNQDKEEPEQPTEAPTEQPTEEPTTEEPTTEAPTTEPTDPTAKPIEVIGAVINEVTGNRVVFAWGQTVEQIESGQQYNVYIDGQLYTTTAGAATLDYTFDEAGSHTIVIKAFLNGVESEGVTLDVNIEGESGAGIDINGFQISNVNFGVRAVSSVEPKINGKEVVSFGNIYGIVRDGYSDDDMVIGSTSYFVRSFEATSNSVIDFPDVGSETATDYVMTMINNGYTAEAYTQQYKIRAYAELSDGSYVYSDIYDYSIFELASYVYDNKISSRLDAHEYIYNNILKVVNPEYVEVEYSMSNGLVTP